MAKKTDGVFIPTGLPDGSVSATADVMRSKGKYFSKGKSKKTRDALKDKMPSDSISLTPQTGEHK